MTSQLRDYVRAAYRSAVGKARRDVVTPALILDLDAARSNIRYMAGRMATMKAKLRPHTKVQKCLELARLQIEAGAIGVCSATVWEGIVMSRGGIGDVLIANQVGGREKIKALAEAARSGRLTVAVDDERNAADLADAAVAAGSELSVLIEVDVGMGRGGVRTPEAAVSLARSITRMRGLHFRGVQGYEGHIMLEPDRDVRSRKAGSAIDYLGSVVDRLEEAGIGCEVVSAGGTGTYDITANHPKVTEVQAGSYVFMDKFHDNLVPGFVQALTVLGTVVIRKEKTVVLDAGRKSIGVDYYLPAMTDYSSYKARYFAEEHAVFDVDDECALKLGDTVELTPGYAPSTVNLYDAYHVVEDGIVVDIWPVFPRGPGHSGLLAEV